MYYWGGHLVAVNPYGGGLVDRVDGELVDVDVGRARDREEHAVGDVLGPERVDALVDLARALIVAAEAHLREARLDEAGVDGGEVDRAAEQVLPERVREPPHREL